MVLTALTAGSGWSVGADAEVDAKILRSEASASAPTPASASAPASAPERIDIEAQRLSGRSGAVAVAEGNAQMRRGALSLSADRIEYQQDRDLAKAQGQVTVDNPEAHIQGPSLWLELQRQVGVFESPRYTLKANQAQGSAQRFEFLGGHKSRVIGATYSTCRREDYPEDEALPWELRARRVVLDFDKNEGLAESAVLRFYDLPILALPIMSFPISGERKTGWLPPSIGFSNRSGPAVEAPWYWNIAPNQDMTITPTVATKHGPGAKADYRYLWPNALGEVRLHGLPNDQLVDEKRWSSLWTHSSATDPTYDLDLRWQRASDDAYWKDYGPQLSSVTPRLLGSKGLARYHWDHGFGQTTAYARSQRWQVLQDAAAPIVAPYQRDQVGLTGKGSASGWLWQWDTERNHFTHVDPTKIAGTRTHATVSLEHPMGNEGLTVTPRASVNTARYETDRVMSDGRTQAQRSVPTFSLDNRLQFERDTAWLGRALTQTLEPRLLYVYTPLREQRTLPVFDAAPQDFNFASIFAPNTFSGVDRIADANRVTAGVTSRWIDQTSGAEAARVGVVQRQLLAPQTITPNDGAPLTQRESDVLLLGSTSIIPAWAFDGTVQYSPEVERTTRSTLGARYFPGPYRTIGATYRYTRSQLEQIDLSWQWPLAGPASHLRRLRPLVLNTPDPIEDHSGNISGANNSNGGEPTRCGGSWYGLGRVNYSLRESRVTDSVLGLEYNARCWIGRFYTSRLSTGPSQATTSYGVQIEFIGLSSLGTSPDPMKFFSDNIAGYQAVSGDPRRHNANAP